MQIRRRSCTGCCWESDQGECLRLFGRSLSSARRKRFLGAVLSCRKWLDAFVDTEFSDYGCTYIHAHVYTWTIAFRPLRAFCSHELNDTTEKSNGKEDTYLHIVARFYRAKLYLKIICDWKPIFFQKKCLVCKTYS